MLQPRDLKGRTAISYTRWSSAQQTEGDSLRRQTEEAERFCATYGLTLDRQLIDPGVSAFKGANLEAELGRFVRAVEEGTISQETVLLVENLDRISRAEHDTAYDFFRGLLRTGVTVVTLHDQQVHTHEAYRKDVMNIVRSLIAMSEANKYSDRLSRRLRASWEGRAAKAKSTRIKISKVPFWIDRETQGLNDRAEDARLIYRLAEEGLGQAAIVQHLNEAGIPSPSGGKTWDRSGVQWTLASKAAYGSYTVKDEEIRDYFPAIVSEAQWLSLRNRTRERTHNPQASNTANLFPRLLRCHHCGSTMNVTTSKHGAKTFRYLSCSGKALKRTDCTAPNWDYLQFEAKFIGHMGFLAIPVEDQPDAPDRSREAALEDDITVLVAKQENLVAAAATAETLAMIKVFSSKADAITREIEAKRRELVQLKESAARHQTTSGVLTNFEEDAEEILRLSRDDRAKARRLIGDLVERITLETDSPKLRAAHVTLRNGYTHTMVIDNQYPQIN